MCLKPTRNKNVDQHIAKKKTRYFSAKKSHTICSLVFRQSLSSEVHKRNSIQNFGRQYAAVLHAYYMIMTPLPVN